MLIKDITTEERTVEFEPLGRRVRVALGTTLSEAARRAGVSLTALCGGAGTCRACRVRVLAGQVSPPSDSERELADEGLRLACRTAVLDDVRVLVPPESISASQRIQLEGRWRSIAPDPTLSQYDVTTTPPDLDDLRSDEARLLDALRRQHGLTGLRLDPLVMSPISQTLREQGWRVRLVARGGEVIAATAQDATPLGLAVDIGTTKLAAYLVELETGRTLASAGSMNPNIGHGEDVVSRIAYTMDGEDHADELQRALVEALDDLTRELCERAGHSSKEVHEVVLVGNTCNHHLVLGLPVDQLGRAPYVPALSAASDVKARELGLDLGPGANVHLLPNVAGFVGADHVATILASGIHEMDDVVLGLDIGTNTEVVLAVGDRLLSCSTASGPAFEGAHIHDGMRAAPGAIERVRLLEGPQRIEYQTIESAPPVGLCGSGIVDAVAQLREHGVLGSNGSMRPGSHPRLRGEGSDAELLLVPAGERDAPSDVVITRKDINQIQLAKGAIRAGIDLLLAEAGLAAGDIDQVLIAGAFGTYLNLASAISIGMVPSLPEERFIGLGNAAGMGAKMALVSREHRERAQEIARRVEYVELTCHRDFMDTYMEALMLP